MLANILLNIHNPSTDYDDDDDDNRNIHIKQINTTIMTAQDIQVPDQVQWVPSSDIPDGDAPVIVAGTTADSGDPVQVARCVSDSGTEIGTASTISGTGEALFGYFGAAVAMSQYDLLVATGSVSWVSAQDGIVPSGAVPAGKDALDRMIFVARVIVDGVGVPAKLIAQFRGAFAGWGEKEYIRRAYEVLCVCGEAGEEGAQDQQQQAQEDVTVPPEQSELTDTHELDELNDPRREEADADLPEGLSWCYAFDGATFDNAVSAGCGGDGRAMHVARGSEERELACGVLRVGETYASIPYYKIGSKHDKYEILVNEGGVPLKWVAASCGDVPDAAVRAGTDVTGAPIWVARCVIKGERVAGKLVTWTKRAYAALDGVEYTRKKYEVLCIAEEGEEEQEEDVQQLEDVDPPVDERCETVSAQLPDGLEWQSFHDGEIPPCAVVVDASTTTTDGEQQQQQKEETFVARAAEEHELVPGGVRRGQAAVVPYYGLAEDADWYDVLVHVGDAVPLFWVPASDGEIPEGAVQAGVVSSSDDNEPIFVARAVTGQGCYAAGKIAQNAGTMFYVDQEQRGEAQASEYEVLCAGEAAAEMDGAVQAVSGQE